MHTAHFLGISFLDIICVIVNKSKLSDSLFFQFHSVRNTRNKGL